ncbi:unnamed protein product [Caenorhabditis brenneri]
MSISRLAPTNFWKLNNELQQNKKKEPRASLHASEKRDYDIELISIVEVWKHHHEEKESWTNNKKTFESLRETCTVLQNINMLQQGLDGLTVGDLRSLDSSIP